MSLIEERRSKNGEPSYRVKVRIKGYPSATATFDRKTDAKRWAAQTETEIREGRYFKIKEARRHTLTDACERYIRDILPHRKSDHKKFETHLTWWKKELGVYTLADITPIKLAECRDSLASSLSARNTPMSPATVNRYIATLSIVLSKAMEWEWIDENPFSKIKKLSEPKGRTRFLTEDETASLLTECKKSKSPFLYPIVVLALATGARRGEVLNLIWNNIDFKHQTMRLDKTKNGEARNVPITGLAWKIIEDLAKVRQLNTKLLFPNRTGMKPADITGAWDSALQRAKIEEFRFHDLRHTTASNLAMNGASSLEIAVILGHKTLEMTKRYTHLTEAHTRNVLQSMNEKQFSFH